MIELTSGRFFIMDATDYWPFAREYPIWNTAVTALHFWTADLDPPMLSKSIERIYTTFCYTDSVQCLRYISEEILFGHFVTTLNEAFKWELTLEDGGYKSGSESLRIPTPLHWAPQLYHVSTWENLSFGPVTPRACPSSQPGTLTTVHHHLAFKEDEESSLNRDTLHPRMEHYSPDKNTTACNLPSIEEEDEEEEDAEEHFPTPSLDDNVWMEEPVPDRHLCTHEDSQQDLCPYPCLYSLDQLHLTLDYTPQYMDLSNVFDLPDVITIVSNEDIPNLEDILQL